MSGYSVTLKAKGCAQAAAPHVETGDPKHSVMLGVHVGRVRPIVRLVVCLLKTSQLSYCVCACLCGFLHGPCVGLRGGMSRGVWQSEGDPPPMAKTWVPRLKGWLGYFSKAGTGDGSRPTAQFGETGGAPSWGRQYE